MILLLAMLAYARDVDSSLVIMDRVTVKGSGVLVTISGKNYVLTARHVVAPIEMPVACVNEGDVCLALDPTTMTFGKGKDSDWAILDAPAGLGTPATLDAHPIAVGDDIEIVGAPHGIAGIHTWGKIAKVESDHSHFYVDAFAYFGSSGSPVYDDHNRVIGIVASIPRSKTRGVLEDIPVCLWVGSMEIPTWTR